MKSDLQLLEQISVAVANSHSYAETLRRLDNCVCLSTLQRIIRDTHISVDHFDATFRNIDLSSFKKGQVLSSARALPILIKLRGHKCQHCGEELWRDHPIPLEVHHKDGDKLNNELSNLDLICPNCHALTENYCGKNRKRDDLSEAAFVEALKSNPNVRKALLSLGLSAKGGNYSRAYDLIHKYQIKHLL